MLAVKKVVIRWMHIFRKNSMSEIRSPLERESRYKNQLGDSYRRDKRT